MFSSALYFSPCFVGLVWIALYAFRQKNLTQKLLMWLTCFISAHYAAIAVYINPATNYQWMCYVDFVCEALILVALALSTIYVHAHKYNKLMSRYYIQLLLLPAVIQTTSSWIFYFLIGFKNVERFTRARDIVNASLLDFNFFDSMPKEFDTQLYHAFYIVTVDVFNVWCFVLGIITVWVCLDVAIHWGYKWLDGWKYWFHGAKTTPQRAAAYFVLCLLLVASPLVFLGRTYIMYHPAIGITMAMFASAFIFCLCYCEYFSDISDFTLYNLSHVESMIVKEMKASIRKEAEAREAEEALLQAEESEEIVNGSGISEKVEFRNKYLASAIHKKLEEEKIYLDKDITLELLAKQLHTNRSKLSVIVNREYGMDFRNVLAQMRVEEAKAFMLANPTVTSDIIASHCGFSDISSFFHRFKEFTGETPRMWIANNATTTL